MTLSITMLFYYAECHYAECYTFFTIKLNVVMLSVVLLNVVMLSVVAPEEHLGLVAFTDNANQWPA
jgi:hypothetical protein